MIESLYILDSSGLCLLASPLVPMKRFEPNLVSGFIAAQYQYFQDAFGEQTRRFMLEKKEVMIQSTDLKESKILLAIAHTIGNNKEEKFSKIILDNLVKAFKTKEEIFAGLSDGVTKSFAEELSRLVYETLEAIPCLYLVKGFLGITNHCDKIDSPITDSRPCDFQFAVTKCEYYLPETISSAADVKGNEP
jgi:hypothetical protein